jgi:hypothetical protein
MKESNKIRYQMTLLRQQDFSTYADYEAAFQLLNNQYKAVRAKELADNKARTAAKCPDSYAHIDRMDRQERNDCTVVALSLVLDIPYDEAYKRLGDLGRKVGRGCKFSDIAPSLGLVEIALPNHTRLLKEILPFISTGRYILLTSTHAFAVIDGMVKDTKSGMDRHIYNIFSPVKA